MLNRYKVKYRRSHVIWSVTKISFRIFICYDKQSNLWKNENILENLQKEKKNKLNRATYETFTKYATEISSNYRPITCLPTVYRPITCKYCHTKNI